MGEDVRDEARRALEKAREEEEEEASGPSRGGWEAEEVKEILKALSEFLQGLSGPMEGIMNTILKMVDGEKVGAEVAAFYKSLRDAGMPEDMAREMTKEFFERRMAAMDVVRLIERFVKREILEEEEED